MTEDRSRPGSWARAKGSKSLIVYKDAAQRRSVVPQPVEAGCQLVSAVRVHRSAGPAQAHTVHRPEGVVVNERTGHPGFPRRQENDLEPDIRDARGRRGE